MNYVTLSLLDLTLAAILLAINGAISVAFRLGLEGSLTIAAVRTAVQLGAIGFVLKWIFEQTSPAWTGLLALVMVLVASFEVLQRQERRIKGWWTFGLGSGTLLLVGALATAYTLAVVIKPKPWSAPRFLLPIFGMVLGNALTGVSLALQSLTVGAERDRASIEARLALGAPRLEAFAEVLKRALRTAITPTLSAMAAAGIVTLPGMMTGQILAGAEPVEAAKYQIVIMFVLSGATALAVVLAGLGGVWLLTDARHRLRVDRIAAG
jgi:putative ABC transport system permease protein